MRLLAERAWLSEANEAAGDDPIADWDLDRGMVRQRRAEISMALMSPSAGAFVFIPSFAAATARSQMLAPTNAMDHFIGDDGNPAVFHGRKNDDTCPRLILMKSRRQILSIGR